MRLLIECTHTYLNGGTTGIQRVVRNVVNRAEELGCKMGVECVPVAWTGRSFATVRGVVGTEPRRAVQLVRIAYEELKSIKRRATGLMKQRSQKQDSHSDPTLRLREDWKTRALATVFRIVGFGVNPKLVTLQAGDVLLLADATWTSASILDEVRDLKGSGVIIGTVIYDLIPRTHPEFVVDELDVAFNAWFSEVKSQSNFFITISEAVADGVREELAKDSLPAISRVRSFRLGADLEVEVQGSATRSPPAEREPRHFIMVGTVEPRKNHATVLDAFDILWEAGFDVTLTVIGRYGWKSEETANRIRRHEAVGSSLFWYQNLNDSQLLVYYQSSGALITASYTEGFGLPVVEALSLGLPVIASDIPSHREIGGKHCTYFDADDSEALADTIVKHLDNNQHAVAQGFSWPSWDESTEELIQLSKNLATRS